MTPTLSSPADVVACARAMLGTPWQHQARLPGVALDCAGLVICVARQLGLVGPDWDVNAYAREPNGLMGDVCAQHMQAIDAIEPGAVLVVAIERDPQHLGIVAEYRHGGWALIHASSSAQPPRVVETRLMFARNMTLRGIFRLPGVIPQGQV